MTQFLAITLLWSHDRTQIALTIIVVLNLKSMTLTSDSTNTLEMSLLKTM